MVEKKRNDNLPNKLLKKFLYRERVTLVKEHAVHSTHTKPTTTSDMRNESSQMCIRQ